jgi:hypothetical protein
MLGLTRKIKIINYKIDIKFLTLVTKATTDFINLITLL